MTPNSEILDKIFTTPVQPSERYRRLGLQFNPFPKSGTANINISDLYNLKLIPAEDKVTNQILEFISHALNVNGIDSQDRFLSATITGDYGTGKTQLLMFVKSVLGKIASEHAGQKNPYVIYIDNPGVKLLEFIGSIISRVGEEDFKRFVWTRVIQKIKGSAEYKKRLEPFQGSPGFVFPGTDPDPYSETNTVSYKQFLNSFNTYITNTRDRKKFEETLRSVLVTILGGKDEAGDPVLAEYFFELISDELNVNKTWEALSTGGLKQLDKKVVEIIRYIVHLIKEQGYTDVFILVDEFEDITRGRLSKQQVDNYVYNLRTLIDEHREWCLLFSMTGEALKKLRSISPPLADRISNRVIRLTKFKDPEAVSITVNYLSLARKKVGSDLKPFDLTGVKRINELVDGNARRFLKTCYLMVERASSDLAKNKTMDAAFVSEHFSRELS
jgi:Cdc6-like AAA superfamily ATPase